MVGLLSFNPRRAERRNPWSKLPTRTQLFSRLWLYSETMLYWIRWKGNKDPNINLLFPHACTSSPHTSKYPHTYIPHTINWGKGVPAFMKPTLFFFCVHPRQEITQEKVHCTIREKCVSNKPLVSKSINTVDKSITFHKCNLQHQEEL